MATRTFLFCLVLAGLVVFTGRAESAVSNAAPAAVSQAAVRDTTPVAVPEPSAKAMAHYHSRMALLCGLVLWNLVLPAVFLFTGLSARMRSWAQRLGRRTYLTYLCYCVAVVALYYVVSLPLFYYMSFVQPHHYDLSNQTLGRWLGDYVKGAAVMLVLGLAVGWVPFLLARKSPRRWWLWLGLLLAPFLCFMELVQPVWIDPLFNQFQPLQDKSLEAKILAQAARCGIQGGRVYEVNMSVDTPTLNAYVTGLGDTKRIVLWDTTLKHLNEDELLFVLGHEMGHYVLGHVVKLIVFETVLMLGVLSGIYWAADRLIARFHRRLGFASPGDFAAMPLGLLLIILAGLVVAPVFMAFSRHLEHEADRFGLELTHANHAAATAFVKLEQAALGNPRPGIICRIWLGTHPTMAERIEFCNDYRPWETGQSSKYARYFRP
jgi:Zn-dependent protease with chaperone function